MSRRLEVLLHGHPVGEISELADGRTEFRFRESYFDLVPRPVLGQQFEDDLERVRRSRGRDRLPEFFANLVPEGRLRELIEQTTQIEAGDDLALLGYVGGDLPGATVVRPFEGEDLISEEPRAGVAGESVEEEPSGEEVGNGLRFSLAGVQLKLSLLREGEKLTVPMRSQAGNWIAKFDSPSFPRLPENEYSVMEWSRSAGFDVPECHLHDLDDLDKAVEFLGVVRGLVEEGTRVLAVRRYDRVDDRRIHQEDFAQVRGLAPAKKYEQVKHEDIALLVRRLMGEGAVDEYIRRLVLMVATGNGDAHLKNWSLIYPDGISAAWSPLYDQVATIAWRGTSRQLALKLAGVKNFGQIDRQAFERLGLRAQIDNQRIGKLIDETLDRLRRTWRELRGELPLLPAHREAIEEHWRRAPLLRSAGALT